MKITFIRHSKVLFNWKPFYNTASFESACLAYDTSPVQIGEQLKTNGQTVYISTLSRTEETAMNLLSKDIKVIKTDLLNEVPMKPFINTQLSMPTIVWMVIGRLQWYFNHSRQPETRRNSNERISEFLDHILSKKEDCIIVGHGFYFAQMVNQMKKRSITGDLRKRLKNEEIRELHII